MYAIQPMLFCPFSPAWDPKLVQLGADSQLAAGYCRLDNVFMLPGKDAFFGTNKLWFLRCKHSYCRQNVGWWMSRCALSVLGQMPWPLRISSHGFSCFHKSFSRWPANVRRADELSLTFHNHQSVIVDECWWLMFDSSTISAQSCFLVATFARRLKSPSRSSNETMHRSAQLTKPPVLVGEI